MDSWVGKLLDSTTDHAVVLITPDGRIEAWLGAAERLFGYAAGEVLGRPLAMLFTEDDTARGLDQQELGLALATGRSEDERWQVRKDGTRFWGSSVTNALRDDAGSTVRLCKILRDRTDVRMQMESLAQRLALRDAEIEAHEAFIASAAHELRNPLAPIMMALAMLKPPSASQLPPKAVAILERQVDVLKALADELSKAVHAAAPELPLAREPVNASAALRSIFDRLLPSATHERKHLRMVLPPVDIRVFADAARLQQMLLALIDNAMKHTTAGAHIDLSASVEAEMAVLRVDDDGAGISPTALPQVFELLARDGPPGKPDAGGGGLALVKQLAALHGGSVQVRSGGPGTGCRVTLRLPLHAPGAR